MRRLCPLIPIAALLLAAGPDAAAAEGAEAGRERGAAAAESGREAGAPDVEGLEAEAAGKGRQAKEEAKHLKRLAQIERLAQIAEEQDNDQLRATVERLREKEQARYQRSLERLGRERGGPPEGRGGDRDEGRGGPPEGRGGDRDEGRGGPPEGRARDGEDGSARGGPPEGRGGRPDKAGEREADEADDDESRGGRPEGKGPPAGRGKQD